MAKLDLLKGMKVVDMASFVAAPMCAKILAEYGADVIRIEPLTGDDKTRDLGMMAMGILNGDLPLYDVINGNKRQLALNTRTPEGLAILKRLLEDADVFVCHLREKDLKKLGLDWETLHEQYPQLIFGNITGYGNVGPYADRGGFDSVAYVTRAGINHAAMPADSRPYNPYPAQGDIPTGSYLAMGVIAAYVKQLRTGIGENVTAHLYSAGIWHAVTPVITAQEPYNNPWPKDPMAIFSPMNCSYKTADGHWVTLCGNGWGSWPKLVKAAGWPEEMSTNYPDLLTGMKHVQELAKYMEDWIATQNYDVLDKIFYECDLPHDVSLSFKEIAEDNVAFEANFMQEMHYEHSGTTVRIPRSPVHFKIAGLPETIQGGVPGEDSMEILKEHGFSEEEINELAAKKIVGLGDTWTRDYLIVKR